MSGVALYWFAASAFFVTGAVALAQPEKILAIRARFRPVQDDQAHRNRRSKTFGPREVRVCGAALVLIAGALAVNLMK